MAPSREIILASESPRRSQLMKALGLAFRACPPDIDEEVWRRQIKNPEELAERLALGKAERVSASYPGSVVLGADTLVCLGSQVFGKPGDALEARQMLLALRGRPHRVITGLALIVPGTHAPLIARVNTSVLMRRYSDDEMDRYIASGDALDKAGAYGVQDVGFHPAAPVNGCYFNVVGLPLCTASEMLRQGGMRPKVDLDVTRACVSHRCPFAGLG